MYFGVDYYPEQWVFPFGGTAENPEGAWEQDAELMAKAGFNVVRIGELSWGLCEPEEGKYDFLWLRRVMDVMGEHGISVVLGTPTAAPPIWLARKHPEILPLDEHGQVKHEGTRRAVCLNSDVYWDFSKRVVETWRARSAIIRNSSRGRLTIVSASFHRSRFQRRHAPRLGRLARSQIRNHRTPQRTAWFAALGTNRFRVERSADADGRADVAQSRARPRVEPLLQRHYRASS